MPATTLSASEMRLVAQAWQCLKTEAAVDYAQLAKMAGYGSAKVASARWSQVRAKLKATTKGNDSRTGPGAHLDTRSSPESPFASSSGSSSKKRSSPADVDRTPSKRPKRASATATSYETLSGALSGDDDDDSSSVAGSLGS